jgi:hypothetical protein
MKQVIKKVRVSLLVIVLSMVFVLVWNNNNNNNSNVLFATAQMTDAPTFSVKGTMLPLTVTNTGKQLLTNIVINYGGDGGGIDSKNIEKIDTLAPGAKIILSPPENSLLESVTVTAADQDISMTKDYRTPIKIPGMMGS